MESTAKHVFFDLDNTLWDSQKNSRCALEQMFLEKSVQENFKLDFDEFMHQYEEVNENLWAQLRDNRITKRYLRQERFRKTFKHFDINSSTISSWFETNFPYRAIKYSYLMPDAVEMLDQLRDGNYHLHIVTNGFKEVSRKKISETKLNGKFKTIVCADEIGIRKPDSRIFQFALEGAKSKLENSIFIGDDWEADALGAADFGMKSVFFNRKNEKFKDPRVVFINELKEIPTLLKNL